MEAKFFIFPLEIFQCSKFYKNEAKNEKHDFKRGLSAVFEVKNV